MSRIPNISLRLRLFLLVLLAILPLFGLVLYNTGQLRANELTVASQRSQSAASLAAANIGERLQGQEQLLVSLAWSPAVTSQDAAGCSAIAASLLNRFPLYTNIGAASPAGDVFCSGFALTQTTNIANRAWFQGALTGDNFVLGDYQVSPRTGQPVVVGAYPVRGPDGALKAVVFAGLDLSQLNALEQTASQADNTTVTVIDRNSTIISRYPDAAAWVGKTLPDDPFVRTAIARSQGTTQMVGLDSVERLYGFAAVNDPIQGIHVAVGIPTEVAFAEVNANLRRSLIGLAVLAIVALAAAGLVAESFILRPVNALVNLTRQVAAGDMAARSYTHYNAGELDALARSFDHLLDTLQRREAELAQSNRILKTLSECNQALVRSTAEASLLDAVCRDVVTFGGYRMAWVDLTDAAAGLRTAALAGAAADLPALPPLADGPSEAALHSGQPVILALAQPEPAFPTWRAHAQSAGYEVLIALPVVQDSQALGALCIVTTQASGFSPSETQLLTELSGDLAFGLAALRTRQAREQAEGQLAENARRWRALAELDQKLSGAAPQTLATPPGTAAAHYQNLLDELAARTSELVGDATIVNLVASDGQVRQAALHHPNPQAKELLQALVAAEPRLINIQAANQVLSSGEATLLAEVPQDALRAAVPAQYHAYLDRYGVHSVLIVAMRARDEVVGTLMALRGAPDQPYSADERDFLQAIADQAALTIANARLYDEITAANAELEQRVAERTADLEREVAQRTRAQAEVEDLYNGAPCGYHSLNAEGVFVRVNDYETQLLGYAREELVGRLSLSDVLTPASQAVFQTEFPRFMASGRVHNLELEIQRRDGSRLPVLISATAVYDSAGQFVMTRSTLLDIADRKQAEARIQGLNTDLSRRAADLEASNRELEAFSYSVSHDLRAPLRSIDGFSLALVEDYGDELNANARDYLQRVRAAAQRMATLIDDLLNLSRVARVEMRLETVDLSDLAQGVAAELRSAEPERRSDIVIAPGLTAQGDSRLLGVALSNLLGNAWKFTSRREHATIEFGATGADGHQVFFVRDNGAGFDMAYVQRLFAAFQRLHDQNEYPGTGIGLATVQRIIRRHGGQIWAEGQPDQGATFYFTIGHKHERENHPAS